MRTPTVILSAAIHVGLAAGLIATAQNRELKRKAISVAVSEEKKKAKPKPPPPPPPPPVVHRVAPRVVASLPKAETVAPTKAAAPAPVAMALTMSNEDVGPGIALGGGRETPAAEKSAPRAVKVASAISERRTRNIQQQIEGAPGEQPCNEAPTDPVPAVTTEINYSLYPQAQQEGIEGKFKARIIVGANGEVTDVEVVTSLEPGFDAAIKAALMRWRFKPAMQCGRPVAGGIHKFTARFELAD